MVQMLPFSCDPGYGELGVQEGVATLRQQAQLFGFNSVPPIDLPGVIASPLVSLPANSQAFQAYTAIGQFGVQDTTLQNAMVAAGIANGGQLMTPHLMSNIRDSQGQNVQSYTPKSMGTVATSQAAQQVISLMEGVVASGTAWGVACPGPCCTAVQDRHRADESGPVGQPRLDDRPRSRQRPQGRSGGRRAGPEHQLGRRRGRGSDHEGRPRGGAAAGVGQPALQRAGPARLGLHPRALSALVRQRAPGEPRPGASV